MATLTLQCNSLLLNKTSHPITRHSFNPFFSSAPAFISSLSTSISTGLNTKISKLGCTVSADNSVVSDISVIDDSFKLTYLEGNSWLWNVVGANILVDPILVGNLDFGIPWLYDASKKFIKNFQGLFTNTGQPKEPNQSKAFGFDACSSPPALLTLEKTLPEDISPVQLSDLPEIDCLLITQSLDDHCHLKTLNPFSQKFPNTRVIATPNAKSLLDPLFKDVTYIEPGQTSEFETKYGSKVRIKATAGPVLGPPWQRPENGYLVTSPQIQLSLYYEPHCVYNQSFIEKEKADIVITPVVKQLLPKFTLVSGQEDAVKLAKLLQAKFVVAMRNGELDSKGILASIIQSEGTIESFKELLSKELPDAKLVEPTPGVAVEISAN